jgi:PAS domain-containing protein
MSTLTHSDALNAALGGNRHTAVIYARADGVVGFWNAGAEALFGHSPEEALGKRVDPIEGLHKNGEHVPLEVFLTPIQEADNRAAGVLGFFRARPPG